MAGEGERAGADDAAVAVDGDNGVVGAVDAALGGGGAQSGVFHDEQAS